MWVKYKFIIVNAIAVILSALNYILTQNMLPKATNWIELGIVVLTAISNAIVGTVQAFKLLKMQGK
jgi:hypothetical protein